jgi:hypothetical protein
MDSGGLRVVVYEGGGEDGEAAVRRMHFELFQEVLYLMERRIYGAQRNGEPSLCGSRRTLRGRRGQSVPMVGYGARAARPSLL